MKTAPEAAPGAQEQVETAQLEFEDNSLLPLLYGEHDTNLARIEQQLGISLATRGNRVTISWALAALAARTTAAESGLSAMRAMFCAIVPENSRTFCGR